MPEVLIRRVTEDGAEPVDTVLDEDALAQFVRTHPDFIRVRDESVARRRELSQLKRQLHSVKDADVDDEEPSPKKQAAPPIDPEKLIEMTAQRVLQQVEQRTQKTATVAGLVKQFNLPADVADLLEGAADPAAMAARLSKLTVNTGQFDDKQKPKAPDDIMADVMKRLHLSPPTTEEE